ncbi:MAG: hypothetical protein HOV80_17980 [Polyangiaceae bacterium]|nr:hypothetical protein [Polyangiaceae bacterium]
MTRPSVFLATCLLFACGGDSGSTSSAGSGVTTSHVSSSSQTATSSGATTGSGGSGGAGGSSSATTCPSCGEPTDVVAPANAQILEASGLVTSAAHKGAFYAHNDSGDTARFFAFGAKGQDLGTYVLTGASAIDWEDMARGPCADPSKSCLYFGDVGDNQEQRASYTIYRVEEPKQLAAGETKVSFETLGFTYPDGSHNSETILVHPTTGVVTVVTKDRGETNAYEMPMPLRPGATVTLTGPQPVVVNGLVPLVTAGDVHPDGTSVLLRTYTSVFFYPIGPGQTVSQALGKTPCELPAPMEQQGESIAWDRQGNAFFTLSEGASQTVHRVSCP